MVPEHKVNKISKVITLLMLVLISCQHEQNKVMTIEEVISAPSNYHGRVIKVYAYFKSRPTPLLYRNLKDALYSNKQQAISLEGLSEHHLYALKSCSNQYLYFSGLINYSNSHGIQFETLTTVSQHNIEKFDRKTPCNIKFEGETS